MTPSSNLAISMFYKYICFLFSNGMRGVWGVEGSSGVVGVLPMGNDDSGKKKKKVEPNSSKGAVRFAGQTTGLTSPISIRPLSGPIDRIRLEP